MNRGLWAGILAVMALLCVCVLLATAAEEDAGAEIWVQRESEGVWCVYLSPGLSDLTDGRVCALLLMLEIEGGLTFDYAEAGEGAAGLGLTVGSPKKDGEKTRVSLLLDGIPQEADGGGGEPILRVFVACSTALRNENSGVQGGYMGITPVNQGDFGLYCLEADGTVGFIPLRVRVLEADTEEGTDGGETADREILTQESREEETEADVAESDGKFVGCRETGAKDGYFSVQLLFYGNGTPVVCGEGGGVLSMEIRREGADGLWNGEAGIYEDENRIICTIRGLSEEKKYVFWIYVEGRVIRAVYENGHFVGYL